MKKNNNEKMTTTLNLNFFAEGLSDEKKQEMMTCIAYERAEMEFDAIKEKITSLNKKIENKDGNYTDEKIVVFKAQLADAESDKKDIEKAMSENKEVHDLVFNALIEKDPTSHVGNKKSVVQTVLRILGNWDNERALKNAVIPAMDEPTLYHALETIHVNSLITEEGRTAFTKEMKTAYKTASKELETIVKRLFSLSCATAYTCPTRVKLSAYDKKLLHDSYVKGFRQEFTVSEDGIVDFAKTSQNTLVKAKKNKKTGKITYNYSDLAGVIAKIVLKHYFVQNDEK